MELTISEKMVLIWRNIAHYRKMCCLAQKEHVQRVDRKKILLLSLFLFLAMTTSPTTFANYPTYLNGDRNFILVDGHMGVAWYVDRSSLKVNQYLPPHYIIMIPVICS